MTAGLTGKSHTLQFPVACLGLKKIYENCLLAEDIFKVKDLVNMSSRDLEFVPNLGPKGIRAIYDALAFHGLTLKARYKA